MQSLVALFGLAIALFASTNVDDLFVLLGFFSDPKFRARDIIVGQYAGIATLFGLSVAVSLLSLVIPRAYIGPAGIVPIVIGAKRFIELFRGADEKEESPAPRGKVGGYGRTAAVALVTIAIGGDNIGIYTPSLAIRSGYEISVIALLFVVMTALWCYFAHWMVNHPKLGAPIRRYGHRVAPIVLVVPGILIIYQAGSF
jgi:cadmium resistance protein CadD (predicted permease)